ncbi:MAG: hypothetical protein H6711_16310 [Myxococcales bacterium]|nr:hypothetical protein [Myxococcales bacterium]
MTRPLHLLAAALLAGCILDNPAYSDSGEGGSASEGSGSSSAASGSGQDTDEALGPCSCDVLDPPPVACYELDDPNTLIDECGRIPGGPISVTGLVPGVHGMATRVTKGESMSAPAGPFPALPSYTVTAWLAMPTLPAKSTRQVIFKKDGQFSLEVVANDIELDVICTVGSSGELLDQKLDFYADGSWHLVGCACTSSPDGEHCEPFGAFVDLESGLFAGDPPSRPAANSSDLTLAGDFDGCIDAVQIWNRVLTPTEIETLVAEADPKSAPPCE